MYKKKEEEEYNIESKKNIGSCVKSPSQESPDLIYGK